MLKYLLGFFLNFFRRNISLLALIDTNSFVDSKAKINRKCKILSSSIDKYSYVSPNTTLAYAKVGKFCSIASNCMVGLASHSLNFLSTNPIFTTIHNSTGYIWSDKNIYQEYKEVNIGNDVWIGSNVLIVGGVTIGDGAIIGAGAVVTKDVPPYTVAGGVPAKIIRPRFSKEIVDKLLAVQWWNFDDKLLKESVSYFQKEDITLSLLNEFENNKRNI